MASPNASTSPETMSLPPSDMDADCENRLKENGFSINQIDSIKSAGISKKFLDRYLTHELDENQLQQVYNVLSTLIFQLPSSLKLDMFFQDTKGRVPSFATWVRDIPTESERRLIRDLYEGLANESKGAYVFEQGDGYVQIRDLYAEGVAKDLGQRERFPF
jgi:hypothetical protein